MKIGDRIYQEREKQEMSARELSKKAGLSNAMISLYERNVNVPSIEKLEAIALALNVPISKLLDEDVTLYQPYTNLKKEEQDLLHYYRLVDAAAKTMIMNVARTAYEAQIKIVQATPRTAHTA
ncbi:helix-turn-helix transcriptional regulator [Fannyhessea vaginae]|uniref:helix-turn-helix domain-containing protein n=1 Tax=Fannyhessea vaginae TaxID=82135 RepID=UPI00288A61A4|nr:helix-turn-helix transcriptional regulator [Fannyhessea vaginae]